MQCLQVSQKFQVQSEIPSTTGKQKTLISILLQRTGVQFLMGSTAIQYKWPP